MISFSYLLDADVSGVFKSGLISVEIIQIINVVGAFLCFFPAKDVGIEVRQIPKPDRNLAKRTVLASFLILLLIPLTIYGLYLIKSRTIFNKW